MFFNGGVGNGLDFRLFDGTSWSIKTVIDSTGNVGIGTTSPAYNLHLHSTAAATVGQAITNLTTGSTASDGVFLGIDSGGAAYLYNRENGVLRFGTNNAERMVITAAGTVGIGTGTVNATLDVEGYIKLKKNSSAPITCSATSDGSIAMTSARRLCVCDGTSWTDLVSAAACSW